MIVVFLILIIVELWRPANQFLVSEPPRCQSCRIDHGRNTICTEDDIIVCPSHETYCMNTFLKFGSRQTIAKRCATSTECEHFLSLSAVRNGTCNERNGFINADHGQCHYCCKANTAALPCNFDNIPGDSVTTAGYNHVSSHGSHHHSKMSTSHHTEKISSSKATTTTYKTTLIPNSTYGSTVSESTFHQNTKPGGNICQKCTSGKGKACSPNDVVFCPSDEPYCLNTFFTFGPKETLLNKRCAKVKECHFFALDLSANKHNCSISPGFPSEEFKQCHYCCKTHDNAVVPCNLMDIPATVSASNAPVTTAWMTRKPVTTQSTTKMPTTTVSTTKMTISTVSTTTKPPTTVSTTKMPTTTVPTTREPTTSTTNMPTTTYPTTKMPITTVSTTKRPTTLTPTSPSTTPKSTTPISTLCPDNITKCMDDPRADCADLDKRYGLCKNKGDRDRILQHCSQYCGICDELCALKVSTSSPSTISPATTLPNKYSCTVGKEIVCRDDPNVNCKLPATRVALCQTSLASKYCPVSCGVCHTLCTVVTAATTTTTKAVTLPPPTTATPNKPNTLSTSPAKCYQCGDINGYPCSSSDLYGDKILAESCTSSSPFCMTEIRSIDGNVSLFKRCVDKQECIHLWLQQSSDKDYCVHFGKVPQSGSFTCFFCCNGNMCNKGIVPPNNNTLYTGR